MKIPESIIEKYQLTPSGEQCGKSFMNNLVVYRSGMPQFEGLRFMECDLNGNPQDYVTILKVGRGKAFDATAEFLGDIETAFLTKLLEEYYSK